MTELVVMDTVNLHLKRKSDGHLVAKTKTQMGAISQTVGEERLKGSIGNGTIAVLSTDKELEVSYRNALWDLNYLAMTQGVAIEKDKSVKITKGEKALVADNAGVLEATLSTEAAAITTAQIEDADGEQQEVAVTAGKITIPEGFTVAAGDKIQVFYKLDVTGDVVEFDSQKFSENYEIEMTTICYNPDTMQVVKDLYIQFDNVKPSGAFDMNFEAGTAITPELSFMVLNAEGTTSMGRIFTVDRV